MCLIAPDGGDAQIVSDDFLLSAKSPFSSHLIKVKATGKYDIALYSARVAKMWHASSLAERLAGLQVRCREIRSGL